MDDKIDKIINLAGTKNKLQIIYLILATLSFSNVLLIQICLPYLEKPPDVEYFKPIGQHKVKVHEQFDYEMCNWDPKSYNITKVYGYSLISETGIKCEPFKVGLISVATFLGAFLASTTYYFVIDKKGRKFSMIFGTIAFLIFNVGITFFKSYYPILICFFMINFFAMFPNYATLFLSQESTHQDIRGIFGLIINSGYPFTGIIYFPLFVYFENWRYVFYINSAIIFLILIIFLMFSFESPRFYIKNGDFDEALKLLEKISKFNGVLKNYNKKILEKNVKEDIRIIKEYIENKKNKHDNSTSYTSLIKYPSIRYKFIIMSFIGFSISGSYNSLAVYIKNWPGDIFHNSIINYSIEAITGVFTSFIVNTKLGRKGSMISLYIFAIIGYIVLIFVKMGNKSIIIVNLIVKTSISNIFNILYTYFLEIYPSPVRAIGFGLNTAFDNLGGSSLPFFLEYLKDRLINILLCILSTSNLLLLFCLPETRGHPLPEEIPEVAKEYSIESEIGLYNKNEDSSENNTCDNKDDSKEIMLMS